MTTPREWAFGTHRATFEAPDLLVFRFVGPSRLEDVKRVLEICEELGARHPLYVISDVANSTLEREARDHLVHHSSEAWFKGQVYLGTGPVERAGAKALMLALYLLGRWRVPLEFADTEAEARELIARQRARDHALRSASVLHVHHDA
ncbi:hypothetical protein KRR26_09540 [Corallococcus sp. M34]|uniref:hypothetical protein n=1 Tax=Citreicoccus inhibens TaxID=2849499 RepID=UPI0011C396DD|nr:hypothetical protein [Citreicoccus inhibens]MBU8895848.1 hypothetical protein [Citreicoccus inhibens]